MANYAIVAVNVLAYMLLNAAGIDALREFRDSYLVLYVDDPSIHQFLTYQFLHADIIHLAGNMLFLWVFGNGVNARMGHLPYVLFYLAGGVLAALGFALGANHGALVGASGAIASVTTAFLVLFPKSRVTFLYWFFFIGQFELPSLIIIGFKIILWDNVLAPSLAGSSGSVAYSAHLAGYSCGFAAMMLLLLIRAVPRDHFDLPAVLKRWNQRRAFTSTMSDPAAQARAKYGRVARPVTVGEEVIEKALDRIAEMRANVSMHIAGRNWPEAIEAYEQLISTDPEQFLSRENQLLVGKQLYSMQRYPQAASAFEKYLLHYKGRSEYEQIQLLLGIIYARELGQYEAAERHLQSSLETLSDQSRREQCTHWLEAVKAALGKPQTSE